MGYRIGIIGVTSAVGRVMLECLSKSKLVISEIRLFESDSSIKQMAFKGQMIDIKKIDDQSFDSLDYVLGASDSEVALNVAPLIVKAGSVFIDSSNAFRNDLSVPLVVMNINAEDAYLHKGIIASPNCTTVIGLLAMNPISRLTKIKKIHATTYQAVSGSGVKGMHELVKQNKAIASGEEVKVECFNHQIAYNIIPSIGKVLANGYTEEEMRFQNEARRIMHDDELLIDCTCVRVPVMRAHSISLNIECLDKVNIDVVKEAIINESGLKLKDDLAYPMPLEVSNQDIIEVGRIRKDLCLDNGISMFCTGDQIRVGLANNVIQILEFLAK